MLPCADWCGVGSCSRVWRLLPFIQHLAWVGSTSASCTTTLQLSLRDRGSPTKNCSCPGRLGNPCPAPRLCSISTELKKAALVGGYRQNKPTRSSSKMLGITNSFLIWVSW